MIESEIRETGTVTSGRLKRINKLLRIENNLRPIKPSNMYNYVIEIFHRQDKIKPHFGTGKTYELIKKRFYGPNTFRSIKNFVSSCQVWQQCKSDAAPEKAPLITVIVPDRPMDFICIDIAYLEPDDDGYRYMLLIWCMFSKFIAAVPLMDQTAPIIVEAI